jgi:hypothetical protein
MGMRWLGLFAALGGLLAFASCGDSGGDVVVACTTGTGAGRVCLEISTNHAGAAGAAQANTDCTMGGGVASSMCSRVGADGGCSLTMTSGAITVTTTQWFYAGAAAKEMASCTNGGQTWVSP